MNTDSFMYRHIGPRAHDIEPMLETIGVDSFEQLIDETIPDDIRSKKPLDLPLAMSEYEFMTHVRELGVKNRLYRNYIGLGYHDTVLPGVIQRNVLENPGWYTAYTPYQAEIAQGRLEALVNFQTMIMELTGMEIANASLLDEATAAAEAMTMLHAARSREQKKAGVDKFFVSKEVFPQTLDVLLTRSVPVGIEVVVGDHREFEPTDEFYGALLQYPASNGETYDYKPFADKLKAAGLSIAAAADIMSLVLLTPPGEWGADVVVGTTQRFGIPLGYGGPHAAYFATLEPYKRHVPGRIIGVSMDADGKPALRMALQTREQHIKRDKATSNICTAQVLLAVMAGMYGVHHGASGLRNIARKIHGLTCALAGGLEALGYKLKNETFFDTLSIDLGESLLWTGDSIQPIARLADEHEMNFLYVDDRTVSIALNETTRLSDVQEILEIFATAKGATVEVPVAIVPIGTRYPESVERTSEFMQHDIFTKYHSETDMMRYIKKLERRDLSLNHSMITLGSCTMKLNAATEMIPLTWPTWANVHPFAPVDQAAGYQEMLRELERYLTEITGLEATSLQPNSGAQGEYAGLMVIREYHWSRGDYNRNIVLIPSSAHGTNPASGVMAGMKVVVVACDDHGNIDVADLRAKAEQHKENLSALMITYPSTHGVYEASVKEITGIIHENGGQVYMDGANMNAQVGLTSPGMIGADVCHLNLHKTFAIPHGGGGPGMGPICVAKHLVPFLPNHVMIRTGGTYGMSAVSAAPWGSGLILLISYAYIRMLGADGLTKSTEYAILNANYVKARLEKHYGILYSGENGRCAHEFILECRDFKAASGIEVTDIAKRLMDYGFHAPTVSFPVAGTLMIEPTESEGKNQLDRFCDTMISIREEVRDLEEGKMPKDNNPLVNAPHTLDMAMADEWKHPYSRSQATFPLPWINHNKFWPSVRRIDQAYGDRHLVCSCEPMEAYQNEVEEMVS
ncbi:MAG: aminomethyl-transferring glycine dehydrogenase [Flavobacteriales bacterium]|nr:aminomethyl-transferring glycine dehydrogenase [Flavobacteriales bacterium]